ncbi:Hydrophobic seed protein domain [Dillenia turbinata]|uniref:Hydrophobic seed protein domain n=1 Tax=Dillenia turbinata TaxID=194707 RepID=A0AAN8VCE6_9MAGN
MSSNKLSCVLIIFSLLFYATFSSACYTCGCGQKPPPCYKPPPPPVAYCPKDTLKFGVCADLLGGLVGAVLGTPVSEKCCSLLEGLADLEVALCLCTALKANVLGINLNVPISLSVIVSACQKTIPPGFKSLHLLLCCNATILLLVFGGREWWEGIVVWICFDL